MCSSDLDFLGVTIGDRETGISIAQKLLKLIGLRLICIGQRRNDPLTGLPLRSDGSPVRLYALETPSDNRSEIFARWLLRDESKPFVTPNPINLLTEKGVTISTTERQEASA